MCADKFKGYRVIEIHISKIKNVAQMSKPIKIKVKHDQGHLYIVIFGIYRIYQAAILIFDILFDLGVMAKRLNPHVENFKILARQNLMTTVLEVS